MNIAQPGLRFHHLRTPYSGQSIAGIKDTSANIYRSGVFKAAAKPRKLFCQADGGVRHGIITRCAQGNVMSEPRVICYRTPINMRLSEKSLSELVSQAGHKLDCGDLFIFFNSRRDQCKLVWHDGRSFNMMDKQLAVGNFKASPEININQEMLENLLEGAGPFEILKALRRTVEGSNIVHIAAAKSASHLR